MRKFSLWHIWEISMENTQIKIISIWSRQFSNFHMPLVSCVFGLWSSGKRELRLNDFVYKHISPFWYHHFDGFIYIVSDFVNNFLFFFHILHALAWQNSLETSKETWKSQSDDNKRVSLIFLILYNIDIDFNFVDCYYLIFYRRNT